MNELNSPYKLFQMLQYALSFEWDYILVSNYNGASQKHYFCVEYYNSYGHITVYIYCPQSYKKTGDITHSIIIL